MTGCGRLAGRPVVPVFQRVARFAAVSAARRKASAGRPGGAFRAATHGIWTMYAVIKTGGKQYRVTAGDVISVEKLAAEPGSTVSLDEVLMVGEEGSPTIGTPTVAGASVKAEVLDQTRGDKIIVFKKKRRQGYRRKAGHRQDLTVLRITDIAAK
jgi:large subunit ribosomal protein L21